jgi:hypothetical protein
MLILTRIDLNGWNDCWPFSRLVLDGTNGNSVLDRDDFGQLVPNVTIGRDFLPSPVDATNSDANDDNCQTETAENGSQKT